MNKLIFIGGPTASGKTTLVKKLDDFIDNAISYRRVQGFFDIARQKNIDKNDIYKSISSEEVDDYFINICKNHEIVISDVHYAVQLNRSESESIDINEKYVPTLSDLLIKRLKENNIEITVVYIDCPAEECYKRQINRFKETQKKVRNISIRDTEIENLSEKREFLHLSNFCDKILVLDSNTMTTADMINEIITNVCKPHSVQKNII